MTDTSYDDRPAAVRRAEQGQQGWQTAVEAQRAAVPRHSDFYELAALLAPTLYSLEDLANVLARQVAGYGAGRALFDDSGTVDPHVRLAQAAEELRGVRDALADAYARTQGFWSHIGHIGVEYPADEDGD
jgi:hypothetical protein